jgi:hypothetical protein
MTVRRSNPKPLSVLVLLIGVPLGPAWAQPQYLFIETSNVVSPDQPITEVDVWAAFDPVYYAFGVARFDVCSVPDEGTFYDPRLPKDFYHKAGVVSPDGDCVMGIESGQYQFPPNMNADTANAIKIWSASWTTSDFTPRHVGLNLVASDFRVYFDYFGDGDQVPFVQDALGYVQIVPAPGAASILALGLLARARLRSGGQP